MNNQNKNIFPITEIRVPSVIGMDKESNIVVGTSARELGLRGRTNTYHFKTDLGKSQDDTQYIARKSKDGRNLRAKPKPYWIRNPENEATKSFSPLEAVSEYLRQILPNMDDKPKQLIIGEPTLDEKWKENYRANMRKVLLELGFHDIVFFPEPFAVYQYYKHIENKIKDVAEQQNVLVIDIGGGTFDCCVIRTTAEGALARSGAHSVPLGVQSCNIAGESIDLELLNIIANQAKAKGVVFKDDPVNRARLSAQSLWVVENSKIKLSEKIEKEINSDECRLLEINDEFLLPAGSFHPDLDISGSLNGKDLQQVIEKLWRRNWGATLIKCDQISEEKLGKTIEHYDVVLLAGGSAHLPFLSKLIYKTLPTKLASTDLIIGGDAGAAVAKGIAVECREQADRQPALVNDRLFSCLLNDLYIRIGRRKDEKLPPKVKQSDSVDSNDAGLIYRSPGILEKGRIHCKLETRYQPRGVLYYWFSGNENGDGDPLNITSVRVRIPGDTAVDKKIALDLDIDVDGTITPIFTFKRHGKNPKEIKGQLFNLGSEQVEGKAYVGVDFGTSNSYVSRFIALEKQPEQFAYPEYEVTRETKARLLKLEEKCKSLRDDGILILDSITNHANRNMLDFVFHSNKIEGNILSRGQTEGTFRQSWQGSMSNDEKEAINLRDTYQWVLENHKGVIEQFTGFVRETNQRLLKNIDDESGVFRSGNVIISGVSFKPPPGVSVGGMMMQLAEEIRNSHGKTSGLEMAVRVHTKFVSIHPFNDGNGRTARLLVAAILLYHDLPVVVLNSDDKERYLDTLVKSNRGSLDSLLNLFSELLEQSLKEIEDIYVAGRKPLDNSYNDNDIENLGKVSAIEKKIDSNGMSPHERLLNILNKKRVARKEIQKVTYSTWMSAFDKLQIDLKSYSTELDEMEEFRDAGYELRFNSFDIVSENRFEEFWTRRDISKTWFSSIEIHSASELESYGLMFQFGRLSPLLSKLIRGVAPVSCSLATGDQRSGNWLPLLEEPIRLREIGYANGELVYMDYNGELIKEDFHYIFEDLLSDLIGS